MVPSWPQSYYKRPIISADFPLTTLTSAATFSINIHRIQLAISPSIMRSLLIKSGLLFSLSHYWEPERRAQSNIWVWHHEDLKWHFAGVQSCILLCRLLLSSRSWQLVDFCFPMNTNLHFQHWRWVWRIIISLQLWDASDSPQNTETFGPKHKTGALTVTQVSPLSTRQSSPTNPSFYSIYRPTGRPRSDQDGCSPCTPSIIISISPAGFWHRGCIECLLSALRHSAGTVLPSNCIPHLINCHETHTHSCW